MKKLVLILFVVSYFASFAQNKHAFSINAGYLKVTNDVKYKEISNSVGNFENRDGFSIGAEMLKIFPKFNIHFNVQYQLKGSGNFQESSNNNIHTLQFNPELGVFPLRFVHEKILDRFEFGAGGYVNFLMSENFVFNEAKKWEYGYSLYTAYSLKKIGVKLWYQESLSPYLDATSIFSNISVTNRIKGVALFYKF